ncbi:TetR family transcriptional regulator [Gulosibacter chungangensis]|uniref:TetR family transcriptional regulator n=1 Tax=Gulosibacter chungangensis TaxID=979746 RepID=A0A7J5B9K8_9MICO|nr:TetR family transcriptional regulator [Gulosibacter chungangensis]KAB1640473.1 TetR family transcriptional regulator [Gulosibacter chungangensis]
MTGSRRSVGRPRTRLLDRDGITLAAKNIVTSNGVNALTMASLASALGVTPSALYNHAESKFEILDWIRESIYDGIDVSAFDTKPLPEALEDWAVNYLEAVVTHRQLLQLLAISRTSGPEKSLEMYERVTTALTDNGWPLESCVLLIESIEAFIFGATVKEFFHQRNIEEHDISAIAPTYQDALERRAQVDCEAKKEEFFRVGVRAILTWNAEQLGVTIDSEPLRADCPLG